eukprot:14906200-Ditylum_brightwellii.AAC.1
MCIAIKKWDDPDTNVHERDLKKTVMEHIIKPILKKCLPNCGTSASTVTALLTCMVPNYSMYKNGSQVKNKVIVGSPLGARDCPYSRHLDNKYCKHIPHIMHMVKVTIPGNL